MNGLAGLDWLVIGLYFAALVVVVWWSSKKQDTSADYFLAGRNMGWFVIGGSLFASNIGSEHIVGLAGSGASTGMAMAHWEMHAWVMLLLGWVFVPFYYRAKVFTMPEFLEKRFDSKVRWILSVVSLVAYVFTKVSVTVYAGAIVFRTLLPDLQLTLFGQVWGPFWIGAFSTVILTGIYTVFGGLRAVLFTDTAQAFILLIGSFFITFFGLKALGGWGELQAVCSDRAAEMALWRPMVQAGSDIPWWKNGDFPWAGILIASPIIGIWYWCTDQYIVQRTLAAKNLQQARRGAIWGAFLKVWPVMIFLVPGLIGWALNQKGLMAIPAKVVDGVTVSAIDGDQVFATMVMSLLPPGLRGLVVGGLLAALMSSLSSLFNSCASLFTVDIYEKLRPNQSEKHLVTVGRFATTIIVLLGMAWIPVMYKVAGGGLYQYLQSVQGYLAPPITAVFLLGLFWKRINSKGAMWGLVSGFLLGMFKLTVQAIYGEGKGASGTFLANLADFSFLYFSGVLFVISIGTVVLVSLLSPAQDAESIKGLTYASLDKQDVRSSIGKFDVILTAASLALVLGMYLYFSFWLKG
ncbi:sodium:solute symporter [Pontiella sp.]|uniref:sodium:solute symporter n=1 Tax=Pontiella sp. TaxID=2837462 RepID=UPI00356A9304